MEPAELGPMSKWPSNPEASSRKSIKAKGMALSLSVLEKMPVKEENAAPLTGSLDHAPQVSRVKPLDLTKIEEIGRRPSPPRTLEIQRQRIMSKRAISVGNLDSIVPRRASQKDSPKESPLTLSGELKKGGLFFDKDLKKELDKKMKEQCHAVLDSNEIEKIAKGFVHNSVDELFIDESHPDQFNLIQIRENIQTHAKKIHGLLINCQVLVSPLVERLKFLRNETIRYLNDKNKKTEFSDSLLQYLELLINTHSLQAFLDIYLKNTWPDEVLMLGRGACGPHFPACISAWKGWVEPNKFQTLQSSFIHNVLDNMALARLPNRRYPIPTKINPYPITDSVGCNEISRCLFNGGSPNYPAYVFIGIAENHLKRIDITASQDSELMFFRQVFEMLYELGYPAGDLKRDADIFMDFRNLNFKPLKDYLKGGGEDFITMQELVNLKYVNSRVFALLYNKHTLSADNIEGILPAYYIPSLHMLQKASMTSWNIGNEFFMEKFKDLFIEPYWTRLTSEIRIEFRKGGVVVQTKSYFVGRRVNKESTTFDESFKPVKLQFKWFTFEKDAPYLELISITLPPEINWSDKWAIMKAIIECIPDEEIKMKYVMDRLAVLERG